jgi:hypothetical protein
MASLKIAPVTATAPRVRTMSNLCLSFADVVGWFGLIVWAAGFLLLLGRAWRLCSGVARHPLWLPLVLDRLRRPKSRFIVTASRK